MLIIHYYMRAMLTRYCWRARSAIRTCACARARATPSAAIIAAAAPPFDAICARVRHTRALPRRYAMSRFAVMRRHTCHATRYALLLPYIIIYTAPLICCHIICCAERAAAIYITPLIYIPRHCCCRRACQPALAAAYATPLLRPDDLNDPAKILMRRSFPWGLSALFSCAELYAYTHC